MPSSTSSCSSGSTSTALSTPPDFDMLCGRDGTPTVTLDSDEIPQEMAARLTIALLGQILYMKGQVPFPVASLNRMVDRHITEDASRAARRAKKRRIEFLESYDDLTSHLRTTFVALSTALAKNENAYPMCAASTSTASASTEHVPFSPLTKTRRRPAKVYILLVLGPSPSTAKARYLLELDGFRVEQFGEWQYSCRDREPAEQEQCSSESEDEAAGSSECVFPTRLSSLPTTPQRPLSAHLDELDTPCSSSSGVFDDPVSVPSSPSVTSNTSFSDEEELSESECPGGLSEDPNPFILEQRVEEASLRTGERLLYRALFAGDEGLGFGDEISPTQAHILIRAPRRFTHPTWVPRQSLGPMLDRQVQCFLESESCRGGIKTKRSRNHAGFGVGLRTVGVRVKCQGKPEGAEVKPLGKANPNTQGENSEDEEEGHEGEEDELIWWSWDGKLLGFAD